MRMLDTETPPSAVAAASRSTPTTPATASAARALDTMCMPGTGNTTCVRPHGECATKRARAAASSSMSAGRTSPAQPKVMAAAPVRDRMAATRSSSALSTAVPDAGSASTSSPLAIATPSRPPSRSVCACPTTVTTPMSGRATSHNLLISPNPRIPISTTKTSVSSGASRMVTGSPCSLLKLRSLARVRRWVPHAAATMSLVVVLPTLPVTPTTRASRRGLAHCARASNAWAVSATSIAVPSRRNGSGSPVRCTVAPRSRAAPMNSWPLRSATIGTNSWPGRVERESNEAPSNSTSGPIRRPPIPAAASDARILTGADGTVGR